MYWVNGILHLRLRWIIISGCFISLNTRRVGKNFIAKNPKIAHRRTKQHCIDVSWHLGARSVRSKGRVRLNSAKWQLIHNSNIRDLLLSSSNPLSDLQNIFLVGNPFLLLRQLNGKNQTYMRCVADPNPPTISHAGSGLLSPGFPSITTKSSKSLTISP